ncbi:MAG: hypothetical protein ACXVDC_16040 [Bacteroidia bacterium]
MKKLMLVIASITLVIISANAQEKAVQPTKKFFVSLAAGPSFPLGTFESKNTNITTNSTSGFAKTGYNLNLHFGYQLHENFGIVSHILFSEYKLDVSKFADANVSADHWQYYGILAGPMLTLPAGEKARFDFKALGGVTNVNSPGVKVDGEDYFKEQWSAAFALQFGADFRYNLTENLYVIVNADYNHMKPSFTITNVEGATFTHSPKQEMEHINLTGGIGFNF